MDRVTHGFSTESDRKLRSNMTTTSTTIIRDKMLSIETELNGHFINRDKELRGLLLALLSKNHILILGEPGTAKTSMCQGWAKGLDCSFFRRLITQFSTPDELFGPVDIKSYKENGIFRRLTNGKAPDSDIVYLDEVFKGGPTILNSLLSLMEERIFDNDGVVIQAPLITLIGTSNELPADDAGLEAFYDRFLLRFIVNYLDDASSFKSMLQSSPAPASEKITKDELREAQYEVTHMSVSHLTYDSIEHVWEALREEQITVSDRRFKQMLSVMKADAWLKGASQVFPDNIIVGTNILWTKPEQQRIVERIVRSSVNPYKAQLTEIWEGAGESFRDAIADTSKTAATYIQETQQLKSMLDTARGLVAALSGDAEAAKMIRDMEGWENGLMAKVLEGKGL